ncbi:MAG: type II secretion system protein [Verrucomicrobiae bacterium]|nr:type II secretion system protein [Verrucomicrobiae bacterium]
MDRTEKQHRHGAAVTGSAFTLVELLVVTSILSIMTSILFSALKTARQTAKTAACVNNLRQTGLALATYAGDNNGNLTHQPRTWNTKDY